MKIIINSCYGGFGLSHEAVMLYAKLKGFKLYAFVDKRDENDNLKFTGKDRFKPYDGISKESIIYYATKPLKNGNYPDKSFFSDDDIPRTDPVLIKVIKPLEELLCVIFYIRKRSC